MSYYKAKIGQTIKIVLTLKKQDGTIETDIANYVITSNAINSSSSIVMSGTPSVIDAPKGLYMITFSDVDTATLDIGDIYFDTKSVHNTNGNIIYSETHIIKMVQNVT